MGGHGVVLGCVWDFFVVVGLGFFFFSSFSLLRS